MFKMYVNFMNASDFFRGMTETGDDFYLDGPNKIKHKPISVFCDIIPTEYQLTYNPYNILMIMEPNQLFGLHDWAIKNHEKFSCILTWGEKILTQCPNAYFFPFGISWLDEPYIKNVDSIKKKFEVSFLCGGKKLIEGHHLRHRLHSRENEIHIPKQWYYTLDDYKLNNGQHTIVQYEGQPPGSEKKKLWTSMFSICIENSSNKGYHTEKIIDAFLSKTIPIYWGCTNLEELGYNMKGIIYCKDENEIIQATNKLTEADYYNNIDAINQNYEKAKYYAAIFTRAKDKFIEIIDANQIEDSTYNSQEMEDRWIDENLVLPDKGFFLDIGACYPKIISNTEFFETTKGWNGIAIEPDPIYFSKLKEFRKCILKNVAIHPTETKMWFSPRSNLEPNKKDNSIEVTCQRLDSILEEHNIKEIDLISIDIEGFESVAWSSFDYKKYNPKVIITEHTEMGKYNDSFTKQILRDSDYALAYTSPLNHIIVKKDVKRKTT
jgi:FkbM family methyltransferase